MLFRFGGEKKKKRNYQNILQEMMIWQIHSGFALEGTPCLDTAGKVSSVTEDLESFFERTFFHIWNKN